MWVNAIALCNYCISWVLDVTPRTAYHCCCSCHCFDLDFFSIHLIPWHLFVWKDEDQKDISWLAENKSWDVQSIKTLSSVSSWSLASKQSCESYKLWNKKNINCKISAVTNCIHIDRADNNRICKCINWSGLQIWRKYVGKVQNCNHTNLQEVLNKSPGSNLLGWKVLANSDYRAIKLNFALSALQMSCLDFLVWRVLVFIWFEEFENRFRQKCRCQ